MDDENYLAHHGVIGQKWGVRRYQNPDGSLTAEGKRHRGYSEKTVGSELKKAGEQAKKAAGQAYKNHQKKKAEKAKELEKAKAKARKEAVARKAEEAIRKEENFKQYLREHPGQIYKNRDKLAREDIDKIMKDVEWDRRCADMRRAEYQRGLQRIKDIQDGLNTASNLMNTSINAYNNTALIYNAMVDVKVKNGAPASGFKKMPQVKWGKEGYGGAFYAGNTKADTPKDD